MIVFDMKLHQEQD